MPTRYSIPLILSWFNRPSFFNGPHYGKAFKKSYLFEGRKRLSYTLHKATQSFRPDCAGGMRMISALIELG